MRPLVILIFLLAASVVAVLQLSTAATLGQEKAKLRLIIPKADWEPSYFKEINKRAKSARLPKLRATILPKDDLEARVWFGFGTFSLGGFRVNRSGGQWFAAHLDGIHPEQRKLPPPESGWEACWKRLVAQGFLELPDSSELKGENMITDGYGYVVEININGTYRTYHYMNPAWQKWPEARQMMKISNIIYEEFGLPEFKVRETSP